MILSPEGVEDERVLRVITNLIVAAKLREGVRCIYGRDVEAEYRKRYKRPSHKVREAMARLIERGVIQRTGQPLDLYQFPKPEG